VDDVKRVADQVHDETMPAVIRPGFTDLEAVLNSSDWLVEYDVKRFWKYVRPSLLIT